MQHIDGKALAARIRQEVAKQIQTSTRTPKLCVLLVGDDPASHVYVRLKEKACAEVGITTDIRRVSADVSDADLLRTIETWNTDPTVHGILVQLPLPVGHDTDAIIAAIDPRKDADGFHPNNLKQLMRGEGTIIPPLLEGILRLIGETAVAPNRTPTVIIAKNDIFSAPLAYLLKKAGAFVRTYTPDDMDTDAIRDAKIIICAVGRRGLLTRDLISSGACVIDVGINQREDGRVVGDVDAYALKDIPGWITPVPGGVGPMTIAMLLKNVTALASRY